MKELEQILRKLSNRNIKIILWYARWKRLICTPVPMPVHFAIVASLFMFLLLPILPLHPMSLAIAGGGGLVGALLLVGGKINGKQIR